VAKVSDRYLEDRRQEILAAARTVFVEKGYAAATINDIATRAGIAAGSIYRYFPAKADLIAEVALDCFHRDTDRWQVLGLESGSPAQALLQLGEETRARLTSDEVHEEAILRLESYLAAARDPELRARLNASLEESSQILASLLAAAQQQGEFDDRIDAYALAVFLHTVGSGIGTLSVPRQDQLDVNAVWDVLLTLVLPLFRVDLTTFATSSEGHTDA
jgi:TetR/AcrR family transcriptional regulator, transcriptional repressor of aconitase